MSTLAQLDVELIQALLIFGLVLSIWLMGVMIWLVYQGRRDRRIQSRLGLGRSPQTHTRELRLWVQNKERTAIVKHHSVYQMRRRRILHIVRSIGWEGTLGGLLLLVACATLLLFVVTLLITSNVIVALAAVGVGLGAFWAFIRMKLNAAVAKEQRQLVDALQVVTRSLRAGHPLLGAFQLVAEELEAPMSEIFGGICQQHQLGVGLGDAVQLASAESDSEDLRMFAALVNIQMRSGGNLADMVNRVTQVIRERVRLQRRVRTLSAQSQFAKRVLLVLPVLIFVLLNLMNPEYMSPLYEQAIGRWMLFFAGVGMIVGAWVMNRVAMFKY